MGTVPKILIVDDKPENIFSLEQILADVETQLITATNGNEALISSLNHDFALALIDVQMPEMDGYELAELLRSEKKTRTLPILFISAVYSSDYHIFKGYETGAVDFLIKPFDDKILISKINVFLDLYRQKRELEHSKKLIRKQYNDLMASDVRFEALVNTIPDIVYSIDTDGRFTFINNAIEKLGYQPTELIGMHYSNIMLPMEVLGISRKETLELNEMTKTELKKSFRLFDERRTGERKTTGLEIRLMPKMGRHNVTGVVESIGEDAVVVEVNSSGFYSHTVDAEEKLFLGSIGVIRDITQRKKLENGLKRAKDDLECKVEERTRELTQKNHDLIREIEMRKKAEVIVKKAKDEWQNIFNAIGHMAMILDADYTIMAVNSTTVEKMGRPIHELVGRKCYELFCLSDHQVNPICPLPKQDGKVGVTVNELTLSSLNKTFIVSCTPILDAEGKLDKIIHIMTDISERKRLEKDLLQAHKMEAIGTLAGGIAHDFNNILTSILGYTHLIMMDVEKGSLIDEHSQEIYKAGLRATDLVRQILTFARKTDDEMAPIRVDVIAKEVLKLLRSSIPTSIEILSDIQAKSKIMANATQIHQVIMNLCTNASHAMEEREGVLRVALNEKSVDYSEKDLLNDITPGRYLELMVSDTGTGISPEIMDRIFEPYFTTKSMDKGTGMGLAMVQSIVHERGGTIQVKSQPDVGTTFTLLFPVTMDEEKDFPLPPTSTEPLQEQGHGHILVVDDEPTITMFGKRLLERSGYTVTTFNCPKEALACFKKTPDAFDMLVTDLTMPKIRGDELIRQIEAITPDLPCVLITGYGKELEKDTDYLKSLKAILIKPLDRTQLISTIQHLLK